MLNRIEAISTSHDTVLLTRFLSILHAVTHNTLQQMAIMAVNIAWSERFKPKTSLLFVSLSQGIQIYASSTYDILVNNFRSAAPIRTNKVKK